MTNSVFEIRYILKSLDKLMNWSGLKVEEVYSHESYGKPASFQNDIAIIKVIFNHIFNLINRKFWIRKTTFGIKILQGYPQRYEIHTVCFLKFMITCSFKLLTFFVKSFKTPF